MKKILEKIKKCFNQRKRWEDQFDVIIPSVYPLIIINIERFYQSFSMTTKGFKERGYEKQRVQYYGLYDQEWVVPIGPDGPLPPRQVIGKQLQWN